MPKRILLALTMAVWSAAATAAEDNPRPSPQVGNFTQWFVWGKIDENVPPVLGNGDLGGTFDPFGGTTYDELGFGSGAQRDIRTLFLTQVMVPDYWVLEDQAAHFLNPRYYRPTVPRRYLTLGAPFTFLLRPADTNFPEKVTDHQQTLDISRGILTRCRTSFVRPMGRWPCPAPPRATTPSCYRPVSTTPSSLLDINRWGSHGSRQ